MRRRYLTLRIMCRLSGRVPSGNLLLDAVGDMRWLGWTCGACTAGYVLFDAAVSAITRRQSDGPFLAASSAFGAEMDSLCDLVDFGVSPAIVVYLWY